MVGAPVLFRVVRVLGFGTYDALVHPRIGVLLEGLRAHGDEVGEVNAPLGLDTAARVAMLRQPWRLPVLAWRLLRRWTRLTSGARRAGPADVVIVGYLGHFDVLLARRLFRRTPIVLDHLVGAGDTARDRGETGGIRIRLLGLVDAAALRAADVVAVDTEEHRRLLPPEQRSKGVVVPVGAPDWWFRRSAPQPRSGSLLVLFFGLFTPLQGTAVIGAALGLLADEAGVEAVLVGTGQEYAAARAAAAANRRVTWIDWVPPGELPSLAVASHVCLGIFGTTPKALRVVPNKAYQAAAAGCAILTSDTPPQRRALGDAAVYVPPGDPAALAATLRALAADRDRLAMQRAAAAALADAAFRPAAVVRPLRDRLAELLPQGAAR